MTINTGVIYLNCDQLKRMMLESDGILFYERRLLDVDPRDLPKPDV